MNLLILFQGGWDLTVNTLSIRLGKLIISPIYPSCCLGICLIRFLYEKLLVPLYRIDGRALQGGQPIMNWRVDKPIFEKLFDPAATITPFDMATCGLQKINTKKTSYKTFYLQ